jgi:beta-mannosidase
MKNNIAYIFFIVIILGCQPKDQLPISSELNINWEFKNVKDQSWLTATVPGNVHSDLLEHGVIEDPFISDNEYKVQWVSENDWEYRMIFTLEDDIIQKKNAELIFEGLDTYASVYLNDSLILSTSNAFRNWKIDVKSFLKKENILRIVFTNTSEKAAIEKSKVPYTLPEGERIYTRKAQFQYGWDWGPKLNTSGIWKPVKLNAWNDLIIEDIYIEQLQLTDSLASLMANIEINNQLDETISLDILVNDTRIATHEVELDRQKSVYAIPFGITNPKYWWTHNLGEPYQYDLEFIIRKDNSVLDSFQLKKGLRTVKLISNNDEFGESFYFELNGVPVYMKGANYIPQNSFQNNVTDEHYNELLDDALLANMNMLRVWGGGIYEKDIFYELCDEKGILIWQDFMFACAMYPGDDSFIKNIQQEAIDNVKRLRNHASIALWCGNNENSEGWHRWGWQNGRTDLEKKEIWDNYLKVFDSILPKTVNEMTDISYWESSPKYGRGDPKYKFEGDAHDWWIWHDAYPFDHLMENVPRFMSEFGFQSFPSYEVINFINGSDKVDISSNKFSSHQKHSRGFQLVQEYMERDFPVPEDPKDYVYMSQVLQAYGISKGLEAHRRAKPYNMGTLYWQLNDCWPSVSWSSIDFFGNWKALHYKARNAFRNVLISSYTSNDKLETYIVNDALQSYAGELEIQIMDFSGKELWNTSKTVNIPKNSSTKVFELDLRTINGLRNEIVVVSKFNGEESYTYLDKPKNLQLIQGDIKKTVRKTDEGFEIELVSNVLQKDVFLYCNGRGHFSDNYFDLMPNQKKVVVFETNASEIRDISIKTFNNFLK